MNAIILCGGLSTRLGDIVKTTPKALLEIKGKTVLAWQIEKLQRAGIREVVLAAGHLAEVIHQTVGLHYNGTELRYAIEDQKLGTGGAIKYAWGYCADQSQPVVILNGDILSAVNLSDMIAFVRPLSDGSVLGVQVPDAAPYGTLEFDATYHLLAFKEKAGLHSPGVINGGIYIFNPAMRQHFLPQKTFSIEYDVFPRVPQLYVYPSNHPWVDIGVPERLAWAREHWKE